MSIRLELFPVSLLRVAGGALSDMQRIGLPLTLATISQLRTTQNKGVQLAAAISDELYGVIPVISDDRVRRLWLAVRRCVHNSRPLPALSPGDYAVLQPALRSKIRSYIRLQARLEILEQKAAQHYEQEVKAARQAFKGLLGENANLQNGLLLSSSTIGTSLEEYLKTDTGSHTAITKKERSFMEYLSRMYTKPSPFSSFTHVAAATLSDDSRQLVTFSGFHTRSHIHLSQNIYRYLRGLLTGRPEIRHLLPIVLNPTIQKTNGAYHFLVNHDNSEAFQRITAAPLLDVVYALLSETRRLVNCRELATHLGRHLPSVASEEVRDYLDQLVDVGFFELELGVSGMERDWDKKLAKLLTPLVTQWPPLGQFTQGLTTLQKQTRQYHAAPLRVRQQLRPAAFETLKSACVAVGATFEKSKDRQQQDGVFRRVYHFSFQFKPHQLWYEDTTLVEQPVISAGLTRHLDILGDLLARMRELDPCQAEQENMAEFFKDAYGTAAAVGLLQFYKDYLRNKKERCAATTDARLRRNKRGLDSFLKHISEPTAAGEVHFGRTALASLPPSEKSVSFDAFLQTYQTSKNAMLVLNHAFEGSGRMFTKFLHLFGSDLTENLRRACNAASGDRIFAEVADASFFDGNLHPRLMPYEIVIPGGHTTMPGAAQLMVNDLTLSYARSSPRQLVLTHRPSGKEVVVFDLGVQDERGRSKLYILLSKLGLSLHHRPNALLDKINDRHATSLPSGGATMLPRVVYEGCVVLQRKTWKVPRENLPVRSAAQTDWDYFVRLQKWRHALQMPDEVFVTETLRKPQYINFGNPFLVSIFESNARNCKEVMQIQEMLPDSAQLTDTGGRAVEFLAQWDRV